MLRNGGIIALSGDRPCRVDAGQMKHEVSRRMRQALCAGQIDRHAHGGADAALVDERVNRPGLRDAADRRGHRAAWATEPPGELRVITIRRGSALNRSNAAITFDVMGQERPIEVARGGRHKLIPATVTRQGVAPFTPAMTVSFAAPNYLSEPWY
jgi:hypothetical protein